MTRPVFRTVLELRPAKTGLSLSTTSFFIGSCFSENISARMRALWLNASPSAFGTVFNPVSIKNQVERLISDRPFTESDLFEHNSLWSCNDIHSVFTASNPKDCLDSLNHAFELNKAALNRSGLVFITLGSAWVYSLNKTGHIVANCHKRPQQDFQKSLLPEKDIKDALNVISSLLPGKRVVYTVSPVRHLRDGFWENNLSKGRLHSGIYEHLKENPNAEYFPAFELVNDDLRDYRFFGKDMVHPNEQAADYVFDAFKTHFFSPELMEASVALEGYRKKLNHRPIVPTSPGWETFRRELEIEKSVLEKKYGLSLD